MDAFCQFWHEEPVCQCHFLLKLYLSPFNPPTLCKRRLPMTANRLINSFCLRLIPQTIFRDIYPRYPSRRSIRNDRQLVDLMEFSSLRGSPGAALIAWFRFHSVLWLDGSIMILLRFIAPWKAVSVSKLHISRSLFRGRGVWLLWLPIVRPTAGLTYFWCWVFNFQGTVKGFDFAFHL